ncbi:hypothetical protein [Haloarcula sp. CBA1127]|uniref:hypothetical protein n=1 Tax=Haloarcula sp. CBA1127 TaxID=1765055 RepID=UPI00073E5C5C|nr:hypothetical protein [Haloarcula sp. CBA1127]
MTPQPTVGEIVAITTIDSDPLLLVSSASDDHVTGVLLADLPTEPLRRLQASDPDPATNAAPPETSQWRLHHMVGDRTHDVATERRGWDSKDDRP